MAFDFPAPTFIGQQFTPTGGPTFQWNGQAWDLAASASVLATGLVPIQVKVVTAGQASVDLTGIDATYDEYEIHWHNVKHTADGSALCFRVSQDNGATFKNPAQYYMSNTYVPPTLANASPGGGATLQTQGQIGYAISSGAAPYLGECKIYRPWDSQYKYFMQRGVAPGISEHYYYDGFNAYFGDPNPINAIRFFPFSTTFAQGTFVLYGRPKGPVVPVVPVGGRVLIQSQTVSAAVASVNFTTGIDATYDEYEFVFFDAKPSVESNLVIQVSYDGGATWKSDGAYVYTVRYGGNVGTPSDASTSTGTLMIIGVNQLPGAPCNPSQGTLKFYLPNKSTDNHTFKIDSTGHSSSLGWWWMTGVGGYNGAGNNAAFNGVRFMSGSGNIIQGTFKLYGIKK